MKKIVLPIVAVFVCVVSATAIRGISAAANSPIAVLLPANINTGLLVQTGDRVGVPSRARMLTLAERVTHQRAIEEVYWRHRIWPKENPYPKPSLDAVMTQAQLEKKVADYLRSSQALEDYWHRPLTAEQLQGETNRMAEHTKQPQVLRELFAALGNDPFVIAECLARPILAERLLTQLGSGQVKQMSLTYDQVVAATGNYRLPSISDDGECTDDTWTATTTANAPHGRWFHTAVWTGSEMIVWGGGGYGDSGLNSGGRYNPSTDSWIATSLTNAPTARFGHTAVWTGSEMIVWGGAVPGNEFDTGGRYNPSSDTWTPTSTTNAPEARSGHTSVWTGTEMIVWGGSSGDSTGGRYNPSTDGWTATSLTNAPTARGGHTAVWTGSEMIIWGGSGLNTGGRYSPNVDSWTATSTTNAPTGRWGHTAIWTGTEMIVWGGVNTRGSTINTGGRYNPIIDTWAGTSTTNAPSSRYAHTAVWTGDEMIVWGGSGGGRGSNTGARYSSNTDSWTATGTTNAPSGRYYHTAVWTGNEMIVWGGNAFGEGLTNTGGKYCATAFPAQLGNISTRAFVQTGDDVMIGGFIVQGTESKRLIIRAIGPELTQHGVPNALANPTLELHDSTGVLIASNNNWATTIIGGIITANQVQDIRSSGYPPSDGRESAIIANLPPGNYTAIVRGVNNMAGVALVEVYALSGNASSILTNISTRSFVQTGDNVMIGGFIVQGAQSKRVIIRAIGPELTQHGVSNAMVNPTLELHNATGALIASNDNWHDTILGGIITSDQWVEITNSGYAPTDGRESAIIADLPAGNYTAIVRGVSNTTGVALVEVYDLD
jgi:N-acetylneuraminic acid mutarotase